MKLGTLATGVLVLGLIGCGSDASDSVGKRADEGHSDAGKADKGDKRDRDEPSNKDGGAEDPAKEDAGAQDPDPIDPIEPPGEIILPDDLLPDVPRDTPIADLTDDQFEEVCGAYLETAKSVVENIEGACGFSALNDALEANTQSTEEFREVCSEARLTCESEAKAAQGAVGLLTCNQDTTCQATVEQFSSCNQQISAINGGLLVPVAGVEVPPCDKLTPRIAQAIQIQAFVALAGSLGLIEEIGNADSPCKAIQMECPDFAVPVGGVLP
ncbi:MAG: hypothetical protein RJA70_2308 [Pseudomonadota bacterium]|jgi:hypothetical protein